MAAANFRFLGKFLSDNNGRDRGTALVVDDSLGNRVLLESLLKQMGFEVWTAANGREGLELFDPERLAMVFLDVFMPEVDGYKTAREMRRISQETFVPIIFLTAANDEETLIECINAGGDDFLIKPYSPQIIGAKIMALERIRKLYEKVNEQRDELSILHARNQQEQEVAERIFTHAVQMSNIGLQAIPRIQRPAETFSGDILLTAVSDEGELWVLLGDFTGHGLSASIGALPVAEVFERAIHSGASILDALKEINSRLYEMLPTGMFMGCGLLVFSSDLHQVSVWNGGLPDMLVLDGQSGKLRKKLFSNHVPLGIMKDLDEESFEFLLLNEGDQVVAFTDGVTEAASPTGEMFGDERLINAAELGGRGGSVFQNILDALDFFLMETELNDDLTLVTIPCSRSLVEEMHAHANVSAEPSVENDDSYERAIHFILTGKDLADTALAAELMQVVQNCRDDEADDDTLYVVFSELLNNAIDHGILRLDSSLKNGPEGFEQYFGLREQRLTEIDSEESIDVRITLSRGREATHVKVMVHDSGDGFDYENLDKVFNQAESTENALPYGRGLKLLYELCEELEFSEGGRKVTATYQWQ